MIIKTTMAAVLLAAANMVLAAGSYNDVPPNDCQYNDCLIFSLKNYEGGDEPSPIRGQTKVQAFCECLWNETPDDFRGNLAKFAESAKGKKISRI